MQITIRYFAAACQAVGRDSETIDVAEDSTESIVDLVDAQHRAISTNSLRPRPSW